jgi:hypothetical protein
MIHFFDSCCSCKSLICVVVHVNLCSSICVVEAVILKNMFVSHCWKTKFPCVLRIFLRGFP